MIKGLKRIPLLDGYAITLVLVERVTYARVDSKEGMASRP